MDSSKCKFCENGVEDNSKGKCKGITPNIPFFGQGVNDIARCNGSVGLTNGGG